MTSPRRSKQRRKGTIQRRDFCPRCNDKLPVSIKDADIPDGCIEIECDNCAASLELHYATSITITKVVFVDLESVKLKPPYATLSREILARKDGAKRKSACPICRNAVPAKAFDCASLPKGNDEVDCPTCNAWLTIEYKASIRTTKVDLTGAPDAECECPICESTVNLDGGEIETEEGSAEIECGECESTLEVSWSDWGTDAEASVVEEGETSDSVRHARSSHVPDVSCPRCGEDIPVDDDSDDAECTNCGASVTLSRSSKGGVTAEVSDVPGITDSCPECGEEITVDDDEIEEAIGKTEVHCDSCGAVLEVSWSAWGEEPEVGVLEEGEDEEDEEEYEDDE
jgi:hypothetical protein